MQILFTPGPLLTTKTVKEAALVDMGSRDPKFIQIIQNIRSSLLKLSNVDEKDYTAVLLQGSGTYAIEATFHTVLKRETDKVLVVSNGAYGERQAKILSAINKKYVKLSYDENQKCVIEDIIKAIQEDPEITHLSMVHSETTSGIINDIDFIHKLNRKVVFILDAVSSFGAYEIPVSKLNIDFLISTSNKNIQGLPGFAFVIANKQLLSQCKGNANSLVLDLYDQEEYMLKTSQFRFTPPTHVLRCFECALKEFEEEGSIKGRQKRYTELQQFLSQEMQNLGFKLFVDPKDQGCIITTFLFPKDPKFNFNQFYDYLANKNLIIYPGKMTKAETFRIGSIGALTMDHMISLIEEIKTYITDTNLQVS
ncbi:unnamed protein product [Paramecium sonneborni]|uniref:alanine--glyoxylate transaminase n=1 Tax=Paramecium sonneborni TaxID=65129 RepID=A0A8S1R5L2_9CILI|nr:unnamed protein product [Paramecium sonneborni]